MVLENRVMETLNVVMRPLLFTLMSDNNKRQMLTNDICFSIINVLAKVHSQDAGVVMASTQLSQSRLSASTTNPD